jgi:N-acyl homoserine lactone hydrolase
MVDLDPDATLGMIERIHALKQSLPSLVVVPAHDARVWQTLPSLPAAVP